MTPSLQKQAIFVVSACLLGIIIGALQYTLPHSDPKAAADAEWTPPTVPDTTAIVNAYNTLNQYYRSQLPAGQNGNPSGSGNMAQTWILHGIAQQNSQHYALIKSGEKIVRYRIGEQLPDSSTLTGISQNGITIETEGGSKTLKLHDSRQK